MSVKGRLKRELSRIPGALVVARLAMETIRVCLRYRVTGLASETGFFALLSLPPLVLGLFGGVGYVGKWVGADQVGTTSKAIVQYAGKFLSPEVISGTIQPTIDNVLERGRFDLISIGFVLSLWSGSRALNVIIDTTSIMYGQSGVRGIVRTRTLSFSLYLVSLLVGIVLIPLVLIGPTLLGDLLPERVDFLALLYWPVVTVLAVLSISSLFHISTPRRSPWLRDLPGAALTMVIWALASFVLRYSLDFSNGGTSIYGPLAAPIILLIWLYALAIALLIGAGLNAAIRNLWPVPDQDSMMTRFTRWMRSVVGLSSDEPLGDGEAGQPPRRATGATIPGLTARQAQAVPAVPSEIVRLHDPSVSEQVGPGSKDRDGSPWWRRWVRSVRPLTPFRDSNESSEARAAADPNEETDGANGTGLDSDDDDQIISVRTHSG